MSYPKSLVKVLILLLLVGACLTVNANQTQIVTYKGQLVMGKNESVIIYLGSESGDLAAFCFTNKSAVGRAILSKCKAGKQCAFTGRVAWDNKCTIRQFYPGADIQDLSASGKIISLKSVKRPRNKK
jgi:hypothetical protein